VEKRPLDAFVNESSAEKGLVLTNPPYGERLSERQALSPLYETLGQVVREHAQGWSLGVLTGASELGHALGLRSHRRYNLFNGQLPVQLLLFSITPENAARVRTPNELEPVAPQVTNPERAAMLANRLRKNKKQLGTWARKHGIECYRLYDADMPEFALAIDWYRDQVHVQEYAPPKSVDPKAARERLAEALAVIPEALAIDHDAMVCKQRERQAGTRQYEKQGASDDFFTVHEGGCALRVNLQDYLDTGLFLDHRPIRQWIQAQSTGKRFLNLFCYTGAATAHAGIGSAAESLSVDMSQTYLQWARANLDLNGLSPRKHRLLQRDCLQWLAEKPERSEAGFDLIFLDPPTFSNSARMEGFLDVQRDHARLIDQAMRRLAPEGTLIFSTNFRRFRLSGEIESRFSAENISARTIDRDFQRNPRIHQCWLIHKRTNL
jgi:23S rRNA (guanine2445-N2)-methyltransferase / 23S rRNA (guanine2069-N7)-methyltransferase